MKIKSTHKDIFRICIFKLSTNSEHIRHAIQDRVIHGAIHDAGFKNQSWKWKGYFQYKTPNKFTSW